MVFFFYENWQTNVKNTHKWTFLGSNRSWEWDKYTYVIQKVPIHIILMLLSIFYENLQTNVKNHVKWTFLGSNWNKECDEYTQVI